MKTSEFDYDLPESSIAQEPAPQRDSSRLMVIYRKKPDIEHRLFKDLPDYLNSGDILVINDTKVIPARLLGKKVPSGANIEILLLKSLDSCRWEVLARPGKKVKINDELVFGDKLFSGRITGYTDAGGRVIEFFFEGNFDDLLQNTGEMPLPPYIKKYTGDPQRYQTIYARRKGSVAAPTAGLHFTEELLEKVQKKGVTLKTIILHIGLGTFRPVSAEDITTHQMHSEYFEVSADTAYAVNLAREKGGRVVALGTTTVRCLETAARKDGHLSAASGWTDLFIYPGYRFKIVDSMITNFHLPRSTLLMMVSAFAGSEKILSAYRLAVREKYRFFSFGDAMLIL